MTVSCIGSLVASLAIVLPSFIIMIAIVKFYTTFHEAQMFKDVMSALRPVVAGLIGASAMVLMLSINLGSGIGIVTDNFPDWKSWVLFAAGVAAYLTGKVGPVPILLAGAALGVILY